MKKKVTQESTKISLGSQEQKTKIAEDHAEFFVWSLRRFLHHLVSLIQDIFYFKKLEPGISTF
jgi:hypothetical protein